MTRSRRCSLFGAFVAGVLGFVYACSFPDPTVLPSADLDGPPFEASTDSSVAPDGDTEPDATADVVVDTVVHVDGESPDALIVTDAGMKVDTGAACLQSPDCDCDDDGFERIGCGNGAGEKDCDDGDQRVHPGQGFLEIQGEPPRNGDWNCKNGIEKLYPSNVSCGLLALGACNGVQGFKDDPGCGESGDYVFCGATLVLCVEAATQQRKQACR